MGFLTRYDAQYKPGNKKLEQRLVKQRCFYVCHLSVAETWPLFTGAEQKHRDRILGEVGKSSFYFFARQRQPQQANALKTV